MRSTGRTAVILGILGVSLAPPRSQDRSAARSDGRGEPSFGKRALSFEKNEGQAAEGVSFLSRGPGYSLFLSPGEAALSLRAGKPASREGATVVRMKLLGGNPRPDVSGVDELPGKSHYFVGADPRRWRTEVPHYARVTYKHVYPGIDLVYHGDQGRLEYDFVVAAGADPRPIRFSLQGAGEVRLDERGRLLVQTGRGPLVHEAPLVYQEVGAERHRVGGRYVLSDGGVVGFEVAGYDSTRPLVIDPVLEFSTYLGGRGNDYATGVAVDSTGAVYVTGTTDSVDFPTLDPFQGDPMGEYDVFVTKLSPLGSLVYSTYLGGADYDFSASIAVAGSGSAYVTGETRSSDFPTLSPYQGDQPGSDAFVAKLSPSGSSLVFSTYLGGSDEDHPSGIAVDGAGHAYLTGYTSSADFPTRSPFQGDRAFDDGFVTKLSPAGSSLVFSTYLGGNANDRAFAIAVDGAGSAYVTGVTVSTDFPLVNPFLPDQPSTDAFVTKLSPSGSSLVYSTYLGGGLLDSGEGIAVDGAGSAYVTGYTTSADFPTLGPYQTRQASVDAFVTKLSPSGASLVYSTYLGGAASEYGEDIAVDGAGAAYLTGETRSADFPTLDSYQSFRPDQDAFVTKLSPTGASLAYSTLLGGASIDSAAGIAVDGAGSAFVTGETSSSDFPTVGPIQSVQGGFDAWVAKFAIPASVDFYTLTPCRIADTRTPVAPLGGPPLACSTAPLPRILPLGGACGIPTTARAVSYNVTVTQPTFAGNLRLFPSGATTPLVSSLNYSAGQTRGNNGLVRLGASGLAVTCHQASGTAHLILDVNGYFE